MIKRRQNELDDLFFLSVSLIEKPLRLSVHSVDETSETLIIATATLSGERWLLFFLAHSLFFQKGRQMKCTLIRINCVCAPANNNYEFRERTKR